MPELSEKLSFTLEQELGVKGMEVPVEVQVLPAGEVAPKGKTKFLVDEEAKGLIIDAFRESMTDLVVDYEHQSLSGTEAPAAGWIKALEDKGENGLWAKVQWTARAMEYLKNREYRYLSPVVLVRKKDKRAVELLGAALTNLPAIDGMAPVVNAVRPPQAERDMFLGMLKAIGLPEDATPDDVQVRIESLKGPGDGFVSKEEYEAVVVRLKAIEADSLINEALADGRLTPSLLGWARGYASADPEGFRDYLGNCCPAVLFGALAERAAPRVDQAQMEVNRLLGIADEVFTR